VYKTTKKVIFANCFDNCKLIHRLKRVRLLQLSKFGVHAGTTMREHDNKVAIKCRGECVMRGVSSALTAALQDRSTNRKRGFGNAGRGYLLNQLNTSEQVHAEINEGPVDAFTFVLFLFQHKHVVVKELLQLLVCEVDANLLETVELIEPFRL